MANRVLCKSPIPEAHIIFLIPVAFRAWAFHADQENSLMLPLALIPATEMLTGLAVSAIASKVMPERIIIDIKFKD